MHDLLDKYCDMRRTGPDGREYRTHTKLVRIERGIGGRVAEAAGAWLGDDGEIAVIFDDNTLAAAGTEVVAGLETTGRRVHRMLLRPHAGHERVVCDDETLDEVSRELSSSGVVATVTVGSGTISDLGKMGSHRAGIPDVAVGTAPSNNGYTSAIAAILSKGVKTTQPCTPAVAVLADPEVMRNAPYRMIASGIGDLYSKPVSNADWRLSYRLNDCFFS